MKWPVQLHSSSAANDLQLLHKIQSIAKRPSSVVALARRSVYSSLLITNRSFSYTSIYLWISAPFFVSSPSFCTFFFWFTSSCTHHLAHRSPNLTMYHSHGLLLQT